MTGSANSMTLKWFGAVSTRITLCESDFSISIFWALAASAMAMVKTMVFGMPKFPPIPASLQKVCHGKVSDCPSQPRDRLQWLKPGLTCLARRKEIPSIYAPRWSSQGTGRHLRNVSASGRTVPPSASISVLRCTAKWTRLHDGAFAKTPVQRVQYRFHAITAPVSPAFYAIKRRANARGVHHAVTKSVHPVYRGEQTAMSAIHDAAEHGDLAKVKALLMGNPNLASSLDFEGRTPLHWAASMGHLEMATLLIANGSDVNAQGSDLNPYGTPYGTPLHFAASSGHRDIVELLVANKGQIDCRDKEGRTPLHLAAKGCHVEVAKTLIANNADINANDKNSGTPLHSAATEGCAEVTELLIQSGALIDAKLAVGRTPLHCGVMYNHKSVVKVLLDNGADANVINKWGKSPLQEARDQDIVHMLTAIKSKARSDDQRGKAQPSTHETGRESASPKPRNDHGTHGAFDSSSGRMESPKGKSWFERLFGRKPPEAVKPSQEEASPLFTLLRTFDAESDDGKARIQEKIGSMNSLETLKQISLDRSLPIGLRVLAIKRGSQIGKDAWAEFLTNQFVIGKNWSELAARVTPTGDAESGEVVTLLGESAWALKGLGYEIEGIEVLSATQLSCKRGFTISMVKKAAQKPPITNSERRESAPDAPIADTRQELTPDKDLVEQAKTIEEIIKTTGACERGYLISRGMPINVGQLLLELFTICGRRKSNVGVDMCKRLIEQHPNSGLARYLLFNALTAGKPGANPLNPLTAGEPGSPVEANEEAFAALNEAVRLGCRYIDFNAQAGMMELRTLDRRLDPAEGEQGKVRRS
jgi:ankyrin repeat protein